MADQTDGKTAGNQFAESKPINLRWGNKDAARFHRLKAFASAVITDAEVAAAVKKSLSDALAIGQSLRDWRKGADQVFDRLGVTRLTNWQAETIYRNETTMAFGAGSYAKLQEVAEDFPYWEYSTAHDERVRASHQALDGKIFDVSDKQYYPPVGYNCRCRAIPVSKRQAVKRGITSPDNITPEMQANLGNVEFIGDKIKSFGDWLDVKLQGIDAVRRQMILDKIAELKKESNATTKQDTKA